MMIDIPGYRPIKLYKETYYYTLDDLFSNVLKISYTPFTNAFFYMFFEGIIPETELDKMNSEYLNYLAGLIYLKFSKFFCFNYPKDNPTEIESSSKFVDWKRRLFGILMATYQRYSILLEIYSANLSQLMNPINLVNEGTTRFNDTPQNGGNFSDDEHTSTITQIGSTSENDGGTKMQRIAEIQERFKQVYNDWANEFEKLFINPLNVL